MASVDGAAHRSVRRRRWWRVAIVVAIIVACDQTLKALPYARPGGTLGAMIELTDSDEPPYYRLRPGTDVLYANWLNPARQTRVRINHLGLRDPERTLERGPTTRRILAVGDSMTFGLAVENDESYPAQLESMLRTETGSDIEVWNAGIPGHQMQDYLGTLRRLLPMVKPDLVLLQITLGDDVRPWPVSRLTTYATKLSGFARMYLIVRLGFPRDRDGFLSAYDAFFNDATAAGAGTIVWIESSPDGTEEDLTRLAEKWKAPLLAFGDAPRFPDDPHLTAEGNRIIASKLVPLVLERLQRPPQPQARLEAHPHATAFADRRHGRACTPLRQRAMVGRSNPSCPRDS